MVKDFESLPHTADIKIRVHGTTLQQFFKNALVGMFQIVGPIIDGCEVKNDRVMCKDLPHCHDIEIKAPDLEVLLVDFLSEALYLSDVHNEAYLDATIHEIDRNYIRATVHGAKVKGFEVVELKAVTYHELEVKQVDGVWVAEIVFDI